MWLYTFILACIPEEYVIYVDLFTLLNQTMASKEIASHGNAKPIAFNYVL